MLLTFYDFPAEHWEHLRTTNPIESTFATVRLRTAKTKGGGSRTACLTMVFKLAQSAEKRWRRLNGSDVAARGDRRRDTFEDGIRNTPPRLSRSSTTFDNSSADDCSRSVAGHRSNTMSMNRPGLNRTGNLGGRVA